MLARTFAVEKVTLVLISFCVLFSGCKKKSGESEAVGPKDPDDQFTDPEFPAGLTFQAPSGCMEGIQSKDAVFPKKLSETGCFTDLATRTPVPGSLYYTVRNAFFSGAALKERYLLLPALAQIERQALSTWKFPVGTIALKTFTIEGIPSETRILKKLTDGLRGASYKWNLDGSDAEWVAETTWETIGAMDWVFPAETDCVQCHTEAAGDFLGWETRQINTRSDMISTGHKFNQIFTLEKLGLFAPKGAIPQANERYVKLDDSSADRTELVRTWMHLNCAYCHMPESSGNAEIDLRYDTKIEDMKVCNVDDLQGDLGVPESKLLIPGKPELSNMYLRMINPDISVTMPLYSTLPSDPFGNDLVRDWINSLASCPNEG